MIPYRISYFLAAVASLTLVLSACGGASKKSSDQPESAMDDESASADDSDDDMIPAEKFDEIKRFFDRKSKHMISCFTNAIDAGEIPKKHPKGMVTVTMTITRSGKAKDLRATVLEPESATMKKCVLDHVKTWTITTLPKPLDYSYTFAFDLL